MSVFSVSEYENKHREICICWYGCTHFKPGTDENCYIAEKAFGLSKQVGIVLVKECKKYSND